MASEATAVVEPSPKRPKISDDALSPSDELLSGFIECLILFPTAEEAAPSAAAADAAAPSRATVAPPSLAAPGPTGNDIPKLQSLFDAHGFRTSIITSPRSALSIYRDSCVLSDDAGPSSGENDALAYHAPGKKFLLSMLGLRADQSEVERCFASSVGNVYRLALFCARLREACSAALDSADDGAARRLVESVERECRAAVAAVRSESEEQGSRGEGRSSPHSVTAVSPLTALNRLSAECPERVARLVAALAAADPRLRPEQLRREYDRICSHNATFANALLKLFVDVHKCDIKDVYFKRSHAAKYERITVYLYDPEVDPLRPPRFTFLPALRKSIDDGPEVVADDMVVSFWGHLLRHGYFATDKIRRVLRQDLKKFFLSGIAEDLTTPLLLNAHFTPKYPLSVYLHGKAGAGKSSFVRSFSPALEAAVEEMADPEILVRFVKQNLNKPQKVLELEMDLRPNNNDLSVMSIIQGRRMTLAQTKPGLVLLGFEEMASNSEDADPNQLETCRLLSQRFSGRKGDFKDMQTERAPRNSERRGISGDASVLTFFTSNEDLGKPCREALQRLSMFANLRCVEMEAVSGEDRRAFASAYTSQCVRDRLPRDLLPRVDIGLRIPVGCGDTRPLVRHLRMLAFYVCALAARAVTVGSSICASIVHRSESGITTVSCCGGSVDLRVGSFGNLYPVTAQTVDDRTKKAMEELRGLTGMNANPNELSQVIDYFFAETLAPAVVVSRNAGLIKAIVAAVASQEGVQSITGIDPGTYKMMKSLYDPRDAPNLRDAILKFGKGVSVAVELKCGDSTDSQLRIREMIEDSPSMTAFSSSKSALYKEGLFFGVHVEGEITEQVRSRASLII